MHTLGRAGSGLVQVKVRPSPVENVLSGDIKHGYGREDRYMTSPSTRGSVVRPGN